MNAVCIVKERMNKMASKNKIIELIASIKTIYPYYAKENDVEILVNTWEMLLKEYPDHVVGAAVFKCLQTCKMPPTPADVIEKIDALLSVNEASDEELWNEYVAALRITASELYYIQYPKFGQDHRQNIQNVWENLNDKIKLFLGSVSELKRMASNYTDDELKFEKTRFLKVLPTLKARQDYVALAESKNLMIEG